MFTLCMVKNNSKKIVTDSCKVKNDKNGGLCPPYYVAISLVNRMGMPNLKIDMDMSYARRVLHPKVLHQRTASYLLHTSHSVSHVLCQRTASHSSYILHLTPYVLRLTPYVLHLTPYVLHLTPYVLHLTSYIISYCILYRVTCIRLVCKTYP
jgi:hypothetical protein